MGCFAIACTLSDDSKGKVVSFKRWNGDNINPSKSSYFTHCGDVVGSKVSGGQNGIKEAVGSR